jgi:hypothetical protein
MHAKKVAARSLEGWMMEVQWSTEVVEKVGANNFSSHCHTLGFLYIWVPRFESAQHVLCVTITLQPLGFQWFPGSESEASKVNASSVLVGLTPVKSNIAFFSPGTNSQT